MLYMSPVPKTSTDSCSLTKGSTLYVCFSKQKIIKKKNKKFTYKILEIFNVKQIKAPGLLQSVWGTFLGKGVKRGRGVFTVTNYAPKLHTVEKFVARKAAAACLLSSSIFISTSHCLALSYVTAVISFYLALLGRRLCVCFG